MDQRSTAVAELLHEAGETHHRVYGIVDGNDPDWATWYADWLVNLSKLSELLGAMPVRSELTYMLVKLDKDQPVHAIVLNKSANGIRSVLPNPASKIGCDADI